jgi:hypothetical protein
MHMSTVLRVVSGQFFGPPLTVVALGHAQPIPIFQQLARGDPSGRNDVRAVPLSLRNVEDLLAERGIDIAHLRRFPQWRRHLDEVFVKINGKLRYLWRAVDHEGEVLETAVTASGTRLRRSSF